MTKTDLPNDPVKRCKTIIAKQSRYHLEDVLDQLKFSRPAWAQALIHTWQNEVRAQRIISGNDDRFSEFIDYDDIPPKGEKP